MTQMTQVTQITQMTQITILHKSHEQNERDMVVVPLERYLFQLFKTKVKITLVVKVTEIWLLKVGQKCKPLLKILAPNFT